MLVFLSLLALIVLALLIWLAALPGRYEIAETREIHADLPTVYNTLKNFRTWHQWSPWLIHEPDCTLEYSENPDQLGGWYSWSGKHVGAGSLTHTNLDEPRSIECKLEFTRPYKSVCDVGFTLTTTDTGTLVSWTMRAGMPFFLRFMIPGIKKMISMDYQVGLARLAGCINPESPHPVYTLSENQNYPSRRYLAVEWKGEKNDLSAAMGEGFGKLHTYLGDHQITPCAPGLTVYRKVNKSGSHFELDMAIPVDESITSDELPIKTIDAGDYLELKLSGDYEFMEQAWHLAIGHVRMRKFSIDTKRPCLEVYEVSPMDTDNSQNYQTRILIPLKH